MKTMTLGFLFSSDLAYVALIRKNRHDWQRGKLNGIGGHVEGMESAGQAQRREFREETGLDVVPWHRFGLMRSEQEQWQVILFRAVWPDGTPPVSTLTDEVVAMVPVSLPTDSYVENLPALIALALDWNPRRAQVVFQYEPVAQEEEK